MATSLKRIGCEPAPRGLRDYPENLFEPLGKLIEAHLFTSLEDKSCNRDHKEFQDELLRYFTFAFHHIPLLEAAGRDIAIIRPDNASESAMMTVPRAYRSLSTTLVLPIALAEPAQSFAKRLWLLKVVNRTKKREYRVLDKEYLWGLENLTQYGSSIWREGRINVVQ